MSVDNIIKKKETPKKKKPNMTKAEELADETVVTQEKTHKDLEGNVQEEEAEPYIKMTPKRVLKTIKQLFSYDIGIDLGTVNTVVFIRGEGVVLQEPSVIALDKKTNKVLAIGKEAYNMVGRTPSNIIAVRPLRDGVIADFERTQAMIKTFIEKVNIKRRITRPRVLIGIPYGITGVEKRAVLDATRQAGAKEAFLIEEPLAAAIGANMQVVEPKGKMIIDIGGGTTEIAVISLGGIVVSESIRVAGNEFDESIINYCRKNYNILIGERMAEKIKISIGSAYPIATEKRTDVTGRNIVTGLPETITLNSTEIRGAFEDPINMITSALRRTLECTPPELSADIVDTGILLTGGGSLLYGLSDYFYRETQINILVANNPLSCVAEGAGLVLEEMDEWSKRLTKRV